MNGRRDAEFTEYLQVRMAITDRQSRCVRLGSRKAPTVDEKALRALLERLAETEQPPARVDIAMARDQGRKRLRWRLLALSGTPVVAAVLAVAFTAGGVVTFGSGSQDVGTTISKTGFSVSWCFIAESHNRAGHPIKVRRGRAQLHAARFRPADGGVLVGRNTDLAGTSGSSPVVAPRRLMLHRIQNDQEDRVGQSRRRRRQRRRGLPMGTAPLTRRRG